MMEFDIFILYPLQSSIVVQANDLGVTALTAAARLRRLRTLLRLGLLCRGLWRPLWRSATTSLCLAVVGVEEGGGAGPLGRRGADGGLVAVVIVRVQSDAVNLEGKTRRC